MRRCNTESISAVLRQYLRQEGLETPLNQHRLIESWSKVMGSNVSRFTREIFIQNQTLHVKLSSSILRQELLMQRNNLVTKLNDTVGAQVITDIVFH